MAEELFSKKLVLTLKYQDREDRRCALRVTVELQSVLTPVQRKVLVTKITDDGDFYFLYTMTLSEDEFQTLKSQQGLLVDFGAFPQKFIDLLTLCSQEENKEMPKFVLQLVVSSASATMNIIETNPFKHLVHLALKFLPGTDSEVKKYLADCLKLAKEQGTTLYQKLQYTESSLSEQLRQTQELLVSRTSELDNLKSDWNARTGDLTARYSTELQLEREKSLQAQANAQQRIERERKEMEQAHVKIVKQLETKLAEFESVNKQLTDKKYKSESLLRELKAQVATLEEECQRAKAESQSCRRDLLNMETDGREHEKLMTQLKTRVAVLEQEVKDKDELLRKTSDQYTGEQSQKIKLAEDVEARKKQIVKQQASIKTLADEVQKANQIIKKLQDEIKGYASKLKTRSHVTVEQEKILADKTRELEEMRREMEQAKSALRLKEDENKKLHESLEATTVKLDESRQLLKSNENIISWLNKQLTDVQISQPATVGPFEMTSNVRHAAMTQGRMPQSVRIAPGLIQTQDGEGDIARRSYPQVQYGTGAPTMTRPSSGIPQLQTKGSPSSSGGHPMEGNTSPINAGPPTGKAVDAFLDPKYLQPANDQLGLHATTSQQHVPVSRPLSHTASVPLSHNIGTRPASAALGTSAVPMRPPSTTFPAGQSLASAYFPQKSM